MKVLSLFDGIACGYEALLRAGIPIEKYCASEIDKYPIQIAMKNHPDIIQIGDVTKLTYHDGSLFGSDGPNDVRSIDGPFDLIIGGSPCQGFSMAGKMLNFNDPRSKLFFEFVRLVKECKPKFFLLENVKMKKEFIAVINEQLWGITPTQINSSLVSAQNRVRNYWVGKLQDDGTYTKVEIPQPEDKGILLKDILLDYVEPKYDVSEKHTIAMKNARSSGELNLPDKEGKCGTIIASYYKTPQDGPYILKDYELDEKQVNMIANWKGYEKPLERIRGPEDKMDTLTTHCGKMSNGIKLVSVPCATQIGQSKNWGNSYGSEKAYTLRACNPNGVIESVTPPKIRKLHPIECERLQTLPDNYTKYGMHMVDWNNVKNLLLKTKTKGLNVVLNDVKEMQIEDECVGCIEEDLIKLEQQTLDRNLNGENKNVYIVIEQLEKNDEVLDECVIDTIKIGLDIETHYIQTKLRRCQKSGTTDIIEALIEDISTGLLWRITFEGDGLKKKLFIISTLIKRIIQLKIYTYVKTGLNITISIINWSLSQQNCLKSELYISKIEDIELISDTQRYKALGNGWTVDVIAWIFSFLK